MAIKKLLEKDAKLYVLGDTSYSPCCVDDVNASHAKGNDAIVKFGQSCLSTAKIDGKKIVYVLP